VDLAIVCICEPENLSVKLQLAEVLEAKGDKAEALVLVNEGMVSEKPSRGCALSESLPSEQCLKLAA
jgi:hypothetical protein